MPPRVARELFGLLATATPMTPIRAPAGRITTAAAATAIDDELIACRLDLQRDVTSVQSHNGKRWTLTGEEKNKRSIFKSAGS